MKFLFVLVFISALYSCGENTKHEIKNSLNLPDDGFNFKLIQRNQVEIPSDSNTVFCKIDDITKGQTLLQLEDGEGIFLVKSIQEKTSTDFEYNGKFYKLNCEKLVNKGLGQDYGYFRILRDSENYREVKDESAEIEQLIQQVAQADIVFIRNGDEHSGKEAADHLRKKWDYADGQIKTVNSFIVNLASKSSVSGEAYTVRLKSGKTMTADAWFRSLLK